MENQALCTICNNYASIHFTDCNTRCCKKCLVLHIYEAVCPDTSHLNYTTLIKTSDAPCWEHFKTHSNINM